MREPHILLLLLPYFIKSIINDNIYGLYHGLNGLVINSAGSAICAVTKKYSYLTLEIHLSTLFSICQDVTHTCKDMKVLEIFFSPFPYLILCFFSAKSVGFYIMNMKIYVLSFNLKIIWKFLGMQHNSGLFLLSYGFPFHHPIFPWSDWC